MTLESRVRVTLLALVRNCVLHLHTHVHSHFVLSASTGEDLLDVLLSSKLPNGDPLPREFVEEEALNLIAAGAETTSNGTSWLLWCLLTHPDSMQRCVDEVLTALGPDGHVDADTLRQLNYLEACIYEALRLYPPAMAVPKYATADHELPINQDKNFHRGDNRQRLPSQSNKLKIQAGTTVLISVLQVHHNADLWPDPDAFKPSRWLDESSSDASKSLDSGFAFLAFSAGPRKCLGKNFAILEMKIIIALLLHRFTLSISSFHHQLGEQVPQQRFDSNGNPLMIEQRMFQYPEDFARPVQAHTVTRMMKIGCAVQIRRRSIMQPSVSHASSSKVHKPVGVIEEI